MSAGSGRPETVPSRAHEARRALLQTIAEAAGYHLEMWLPDGRRPDVLRVHLDRPSVFLGEAKHTEGPWDVDSVDRLRHYLGWLVALRQRELGSILAIAHPRGLGRAWQDRMDWLCEDVRIDGVGGSANVTPATAVTFVVFAVGG